MRATLHREAALSAARLAELDALIADIEARSDLDAEADYVQLFDSGRRTSLHLFEHVHGDSRDRGPAMIDLAQTYERAGLYLREGEMPDHLPVVLEYASTQPGTRRARSWRNSRTSSTRIFNALDQRCSRYASIARRAARTGRRKGATAARAGGRTVGRGLGRAAAFDGCSARGQARPGTPQPINLVRRDGPAKGARA